jgi:hypothetical protein
MNHRCSLKLICLMAVLPLAYAACTPKETKTLLQPSSALGIVLAEETIRAAGSKKNIAVITHDANWGPGSTVEEAFQSALRKQGFSIVTAKSANLGDPMRSGEIGLQAADFFEALEKSSGAGAIVSFAGAPLLKPGDAARASMEHPPVLVVSTATLGNLPGVRAEPMQLGRLLDARVIQLAIIDGSEPAAAKTDGMHELFAQNYRILRRPD